MSSKAYPEVKYTQLFINNEFVDSIDPDSKPIPVINPATEEEICTVQGAGPKDVDRAVAAAKAAFQPGSPWRTMDASERGRLLYRLAERMEQDIEYLAHLETFNGGKIISDSRTDANYGVAILRYFAGWADKIHGKTIPIDGPFFTFTRHEPVGVVVGITPWNYPIELAITKMAPPLACGCTVVIKPSELTPFTALYIASLTKEIGFPPGVINVIPGYGPVAGQALVDHCDVNKVAFTGSTVVGQKVMESAARSNLKRVALELGGKSPLIVFADADLEKATQYAHDAVMVNQGQCCIAGTRTFVEASIYDGFLEKMKEKAEQRSVGDPFDENIKQGPQINLTQFNKVLNLIEAGKSDGARLVTGGERIGTKGYFIKPTVFADVTDNMRIAKEEIFGPVQSVFKFSSIQEVMQRANSTHYGLGAAVFTKDVNKAMQLVQTIQAGTVWVNCYLEGGANVPFGGFKMSGMGREMSEYALQEYTEVKTVTMALSTNNS